MRAKIFQHPSSVLAVCCLVALSGCADKVLNNQLANTRESIDQARMAGAAEKAPAEFNAAIDKIGRADAAAKDRENKQAMRLAQEAQVDANLARARTDSAQASIAANELAKSNQVLRDIANRVRNQNQ